MENDAITPQPSREATAGTAKKYIRTLAGDMEILKSGGKPDLTPLDEPQPTPVERLVTVVPVASPTQIPSPLPISEPESLPVQNPAEPISPSPKATESAAPLETYSGDFSDQMKKENASPMTVLAAEQDAAVKKTEEPLPTTHSRSTVLYTIVGIVLLLAGGSGVYIAYTNYASSLVSNIIAPTISAPISVDEREQVSGVGTTLLQAIVQSNTRGLAPNTIRLLYTNSATTTDNSIFSAIRIPAPDILLRNINANGSMAGIVNVGGTSQSPFFILSVTSYSSTFSGMLSWEPSMPNDLAGLFPTYAENSVMQTASTTATTTIPSPSKKVAIGFRDEVVDNHDIRIYRDAAGRSIILYGYWNQTTLVIARDPSSFDKIINRLATSQAQH